MTKKIIALVLAMLMLVTVFAACGNKTTDNGADGTIKIGLSGPLTGAAAVYGTAVKNSAEMAAEEINAKGGMNGIKIEILPAVCFSRIKTEFFYSAQSIRKRNTAEEAWNGNT